MKKNLFLLAWICLISGITLIGCSDDKSPVNTEKTQSIYLQGSDVYDEDVYAELMICQSKEYNTEQQSFVEYPSFDCSFTDPQRLYTIKAGSVAYNSENVPVFGAYTQGAPMDSVFTYGESNWGSKANFNGSSNTWVVSGATSIPAFNISVNSPSYKIGFTAPQLNQAVSKTSGFTITWNNGGTPAQSVWFNISQQNSGFYDIVVPDSGSINITPVMLSKFHSGELWIEAISYNCALQEIASGKYALAMVSSSYKIPVVLN